MELKRSELAEQVVWRWVCPVCFAINYEEDDPELEEDLTCNSCQADFELGDD